jgi:hypothetical protein
MKALLVAAALGLAAPAHGGPVMPPARANAAAQSRKLRAQVVAGASFAALLLLGGKLYTRLGKRAESEEAEALLDAEFARLGLGEAHHEHHEILEELRRAD